MLLLLLLLLVHKLPIVHHPRLWLQALLQVLLRQWLLLHVLLW